MSDASHKLKKILEKELHLFSKETLVKLINLYNAVSETSFLKHLEDSICNTKDANKLEIINIRLDSILNDFEKKTYLKKTTRGAFVIYDYRDHSDIFFKEEGPAEVDFLLEHFPLIEKQEVWLLKNKNENKNIKFLKQDGDANKITEIGNFIKKNKKNPNLKIKILKRVS